MRRSTDKDRRGVQQLDPESERDGKGSSRDGGGSPSTDQVRQEATREEPEKADGKETRTGYPEAVCFTAGIYVPGFAIGVTHAYLAADRKPPRVVAGISMGAIHAAALQRCYRELEDGELKDPAGLEATRWRWFRKYLDALSRDPFKPVRDSLPSMVDLFSDRHPVQDLSTPEHLRKSAAREIRQRFRLIKAGQWLARCPLTVKRVATAMVRYVRFMEDYDSPKFWRRCQLLFACLRCLLPLMWSLALTPQFVAGKPAKVPLRARIRRLWRWRKPTSPKPGVKGRPPAPLGAFWTRKPVFGWGLFLFSCLAFLSILLASVGALWLLAANFLVSPLVLPAGLGSQISKCSWGAMVLLAIVIVVGWKGRRWLTGAVGGGGLLGGLLSTMGLRHGLVHDFHLKRKLEDLFGTGTGTFGCDGQDPKLLVVVSPLQCQPQPHDRPMEHPSLQQDWIRGNTTVAKALRTAISLPPWLGSVKHGEQRFVDGSVVRRNPIPALFRFLKKHKEIAYSMAVEEREGKKQVRKQFTIHVVYNVPVGDDKDRESGREETKKDANNGDEPYPDARANIVDVAWLAMRLANRRDTQLEVGQTNFIANLEELNWREATPDGPEGVEVFPICADEIAPNREAAAKFSLARKSILVNAARGCRSALQELYRDEIERLAGEGCKVPCHVLLNEVAGRRKGMFSKDNSPGLPEVCANCTKELLLRNDKPKPFTPEVSFREYHRKQPPRTSPPPGKLSDRFWQLTGEEPRIIVAGSGGVFRGAFHVGLAGALYALRVRPHMIAAASVGSLMGGALASMSVDEWKRAADVLGELIEIFWEVDGRIALTRRLKQAFRDVGNRSRRIDLSLADIRRMVLRGTRADPGFAATGAPPALIDAIADLLLIPRRGTADIAAEVVSAHFRKAMILFLKRVREDALRRLDIEEAVMDTSLLELAAQRLLGLPERPFWDRQPYLPDPSTRKPGTAFLATTTDLGREGHVLLGDDSVRSGKPYDFIKAALASSAFPAVFAPVRESDVFPGAGNPYVRYADGGIFDNLPIVPAIDFLGEVQKDYRLAKHVDSLDFLRERYETPVLVIVGALDSSAESEVGGQQHSSLEESWRVRAMGRNVKIQSCALAAELAYRQTGRLLEKSKATWGKEDLTFIDDIVPSAILPVFPTDDEHLNGTFAFCASAGLRRERVALSIADGCFQTMAALAGRTDSRPGTCSATTNATSIALARMKTPRENGNAPPIPPVTWAESSVAAKAGDCPYFAIKKKGNGDATTPIQCPFANLGNAAHPARRVYQACRKDPAHRDAARQGS